MNPQIVFGIGGAVLLVWGAVIAVWTDWARSLSGGRFANGQPISRGFVRGIGIFFVIGGALFIVAAVTGLLPDHATWGKV